MPKYILKAKTPLSNYKCETNKVKISAIEQKELFSLAIPLRGQKKAEIAIKTVFNCQIPSPGNCVVSRDHKLKILRLSSDQIFLYFGHQNLDQIMSKLEQIKKSFYVTGQSDAWAGIKISGQNAITCLERICPIDLSIDAFGINFFARTAMEHLNTIIIRTKKTEFELFSASSSAESFLHAIKTSVQNI